MGRAAFVGWLYIMAVACLIIAAADASLGWFIGGIVLFYVARYAHRQFKNESEVGREAASGRFALSAILVMLLAMLFLFWLPSIA